MDKLKYSQLLLIGAAKVKQVERSYLRAKNHQVHSACAIGMIAIARAGSLDLDSCENELEKIKSELQFIENKGFDSLKNFIMSMNDGYGYTPQIIATELEKLGY